MGKLTQIVSLDKEQHLLTLEDKYGASIVVLGQIETDKGKLKVTCSSNDAKHKWLLSDFLSDKIEVSPTGNLVSK